MRRFAAAVAVGLIASRAEAQSLRDKITDLFRFGHGCEDPVCLSVGTGHGNHFNPAARAGSENLIGFLTNAIGVSVSNIPLGAASGGAIWGRSPQGLPVRTQTSSGPIFAERGQTLGRGRTFFSTSVTRLDYRSIRGVPLDGLVLSLPHQDVDNDGLGTPSFESDVIEIQTRLNLNVTAVTTVLSYGLTDFIDLSVAVPLVRTSLEGAAEAQVIPFSNPTPHVFGDPNNPLLRVTQSVSGSATGIGDVAARIKAALVSNDRGAFALLGDVRFATGKEEDFLGAGGTSWSVLGIGSLRRGNFSPHVNAGYIHRGGEFQNDGILATIGFDHLMARRATLAVDVITSWQMGDQKLALPSPVTINALVGNSTATRVVRQTNIPNQRDDVALGSIGAKLGLGGGANLVVNGLVPLNRGGLQPNVAWTLGLEYSF
jgi:hypothetical protein